MDSSSPARPLIRAVLETTLCCEDLDAAEAFYTRVLGFEVYAKEPGRHLFFRCGDGMLLLFDPRHTAHVKTKVNGVDVPPHGTSGAGHVAFRCSDDELSAWRHHLTGAGVELEAEVSWPGGGRSIYFRDPSGNSLELATPSIWGLE